MRFFINEHLASATFIALILGRDAHIASGMISLLWVLLMLEMGFVSQTWRLVDARSPISQIIHAALSTLFMVGFLWPR